jgi:hypothetical protein
MFTIEILWTSLILLMFGGTIWFCAVAPGDVLVTEAMGDVVVAKSLDLVSRQVGPRN